MYGAKAIFLIAGSLFLMALLLGNRRQPGHYSDQGFRPKPDRRYDRVYEYHRSGQPDYNMGDGCASGLAAAVGVFTVLAIVFILGMSLANQMNF